MPSDSTPGMMINDTKNTRKFNTQWGTFYLPLTLMEKLGDPKELKFTVSTIGDETGAS